MRFFILVLALLVGENIQASDKLIYLTCKGIVTDTELNQEVNRVNNDFLINKDAKTIQQIITGLTDQETANLRRTYSVTPTQFITEDGVLSINRRTLEYSVNGLMGSQIKGDCEVVKPEL